MAIWKKRQLQLVLDLWKMNSKWLSTIFAAVSCAALMLMAYDNIKRQRLTYYLFSREADDINILKNAFHSTGHDDRLFILFISEIWEESH